jgi:hypothetical protein
VTVAIENLLQAKHHSNEREQAVGTKPVFRVTEEEGTSEIYKAGSLLIKTFFYTETEEKRRRPALCH